MKNYELRLGNKLDLYGTIATLQMSDYHYHYTTEDRKLSRFKPIPLTEEWLIKMGFHKSQIYWVKPFVSLGDLKIIESREWGSNKFQRYYLQMNDLTVEWVHQLQNIWFTLSNEELIKN